jgi:hypothetical protein
MRRRTLLLGVCGVSLAPAALAPNAFAQSATADVLSQLVNFLSASAAMTGALTVSVGRLKPNRLSPVERVETARSLSDFNTQFDQLFMRQGVLTANIADYVANVRRNGFSEAVHEPMWRAVVGNIAEVSQRVGAIYDLHQSAPWAKTALTPEQDRALADSFRGKQTILMMLRDLPAPRTKAEIDKLAAADTKYIDLMKRQAALRAALRKAARDFDPSLP